MPMRARYTDPAEVVRLIRERPGHLVTKQQIADYLGVSRRTLRTYGERWPQVEMALEEVQRPTLQAVASAAREEAVARGVLPREAKPASVLTADGLERLRKLGAAHPALRHIAAELGFSDSKLRRLLEEHEAARQALEAGRADIVKLVVNKQIANALEGDNRAAENVLRMYAPELMAQKTESIHKHEYTFTLPRPPEAPALPHGDADIIDLTDSTEEVPSDDDRDGS